MAGPPSRACEQSAHGLRRSLPFLSRQSQADEHIGGLAQHSCPGPQNHQLTRGHAWGSLGSTEPPDRRGTQVPQHPLQRFQRTRGDSFKCLMEHQGAPNTSVVFLKENTAALSWMSPNDLVLLSLRRERISTPSSQLSNPLCHHSD